MRILVACEESQAVTKEFRSLGHEEYNHIVYIHNFPNGKKYIGITCQTAKLRWGCNGSGYKTQSRIFRAIEKYGWNNINNCCLKKTGSKTAGGYKWGYNNE